MIKLINRLLKYIAVYMCKKEEVDIAIRAYTNDKQIVTYMKRHCKTIRQVNDYIRLREMSIMGYVE